MWDMAKPIIAQVHGWCLAGGSELAFACDLVYVAEDAQIGYPAVRTMSPPDNQYHAWIMGHAGGHGADADRRFDQRPGGRAPGLRQPRSRGTPPPIIPSMRRRRRNCGPSCAVSSRRSPPSDSVFGATISGRIAAGAGFRYGVAAEVQRSEDYAGDASSGDQAAEDEHAEGSPPLRRRLARRGLRYRLEKAAQGAASRHLHSPSSLSAWHRPLALDMSIALTAFRAPLPAGRMVRCRGLNEPTGRRRIDPYIPRMRCFLLMTLLALSGCSVLAAPCRITSAAVGIVPVVGHAAAAPTNACGNVIDP